MWGVLLVGMISDRIGKFGAWLRYPVVTPEAVREFEELGYGAVWLGGSPPATWEGYETLLAASESIVVGTSIVNVWGSAARDAADTFHRLEAKYPGRFVLGVGVGHPEHDAAYAKPYDALVGYLDELDEFGVPVQGRALAALGPRVARLAAERSAGVLPYLTVPEHDSVLRAQLGPDVLIATEHKVVLEADAERARAAGRPGTAFYLGLANYRNNLSRYGFDESDLTEPGSDKFVDAVVAYGSAGQIADRLAEHVRAGADHVAVQVLGREYLPTLRVLAPLLAERLN